MHSNSRHHVATCSGLPITATFALPLTIYYVFLQIRVSLQRIRTHISLATHSSPSATAKPGKHDILLAAYRTQANFAENVPLALILAGLVEAQDGNQVFLTAALGILTVVRLMHGEMGLMAKDAGGVGRPVGFFGTIGVQVGLAGYAFWLGTRAHWA